jgi:hypothetical protein
MTHGEKNMNSTFSKRNRGDYHCVGVGQANFRKGIGIWDWDWDWNWAR